MHRRLEPDEHRLAYQVVPNVELGELGDGGHRRDIVEAEAVARMGLMGGALRLPMTPLAKANEAVVEGALRATGLLG